jgi:hypothetical protein
LASLSLSKYLSLGLYSVEYKKNAKAYCPRLLVCEAHRTFLCPERALASGALKEYIQHVTTALVFLLPEKVLVVLRCLCSRFKLICSSCWNYLLPVVDQARSIQTSFRRPVTVEKHNRVAYPTAHREIVSFDGKLLTYLSVSMLVSRLSFALPFLSSVRHHPRVATIDCCIKDEEYNGISSLIFTDPGAARLFDSFSHAHVYL